MQSCCQGLETQGRGQGQGVELERQGQRQGLDVQGRGQGRGLENWSSRILEDKDFPRSSRTRTFLEDNNTGTGNRFDGTRLRLTSLQLA